MASRRKLKKDVKNFMDDLFTDCLIQELLNTEVDKDEIESLLTRIYTTRQEFVSRISHTQPGSVKKYYKKFREDFAEEASDIIAELANLSE